MSETLSAAGFEILEATNAPEAVAVLDARPDLSDVAMPGDMNGFSLAWEMRRRWADVGLILSTGRLDPTPGMVPEGIRVLHKPYGSAELITAVHEVMTSAGEPRTDNVAGHRIGGKGQSPQTEALANKGELT
jgi:DNA-binding response OmpR family regulator